jgi:8-oxo-dGTP pyrophosphatase MutT (NUDIX family)
VADERTDRAADSRRRPTALPDRYLIPTDEVPPGLVARIASEREPVSARPASTIVLMRAGARDPEALLLRRPGRSSFAANAWVFPGGTVDEGDGSPARTERLLGPPPTWWAVRLGLPERDAVAHLGAALREAWEETGILLAEPAVDDARLAAARAEVLAGETTLDEVLAAEGLSLDARELLYIAHWTTPEAEPRRYDTRFFLAALPRRTECELVGEELLEARWITPAEAVAAFDAGDLRLLPPTVHTLRELCTYRSIDEMVGSLRDAPVARVLPRMRMHPGGVEIELSTEEPPTRSRAAPVKPERPNATS